MSEMEIFRQLTAAAMVDFRQFLSQRWHLRVFFSTAVLLLSMASRGQVPEVKDQDGWKEYVYPNDAFAITLPSAPRPHKDTRFPDLQVNVYTSGGVTLRVEDTPNGCDSAITTIAKSAEELKIGQKKPDPAFRLDLASVKQGSLDGYPFIEYQQTVVRDGVNSYERRYCVEKRLYAFSSVWATGLTRPDDVNRIIRSFRLLKK
jgi:hypothetical protein